MISWSPTSNKQQGQVLLVGLMIMALITTVVGTGAFRATTSTRTTNEVEEGNKASDIAKGILEGALNDESVPASDFADADSGATSQDISTSPAGTFITSEVIAKDSHYLFYTTNYNPATNSFGTSYYTGLLNIYFASESGTCPVLELTQITNTLGVKSRSYVTPCGTNAVSGAANDITPSSGTYSLTWNSETVSFTRRASINMTVGGNVVAVLVRPMFHNTRIGFAAQTGNLATQGREISSTARTIDGAQRTEKVYQAYPQIPLQFFTTVF